MARTIGIFVLSFLSSGIIGFGLAHLQRANETYDLQMGEMSFVLMALGAVSLGICLGELFDKKGGG